jgi:hypothetical protein
MKLYTEEQVNKAMLDYIQGISRFDIFNSLIPIELPSDEEIEELGDSVVGYYTSGFIDGVKYVINKIQGGNNEQQ